MRNSPEIVDKVASNEHSSPAQTSMTMDSNFTLLESKGEHLDHIQEVSHGGVSKVFPGKVVVVDLLLHEVIGVICEAGGLELRTTAGVLSWHLEVDDGLDAGGVELLDQLNALDLGLIWSRHGKYVLSNPVAVDAPQCHLSLRPGRTALILAPFIIID